MSRPLTDRERCQQLQVRVAELEEELASYQALEDADLRDGVAMDRLIGVRDRLQLLERRCAATASAMLIELIDNPGVTKGLQALVDCTRELPNVWGRNEPGLKIVNVQVNFLRAGLRRVGLGDAIETVWGYGYRVSAENAQRLKVLLERAHG